MPYEEFLNELNALSDGGYREFHKKLLKNDGIKVIGVRVPVLKKLAARFDGNFNEIFSYPDEFYEVTFVKLAAASRLGFDDLLEVLDDLVPLINNWAACDSFAPACVKGHRAEFLPYIRKYLASDGEFTKRFALTSLLHFYVDKEYIETIFSLLERCDTSQYFVSMAAAWLLAEIIVKYYDCGKSFLMEHSLDKKTHDRAIRKACESFRLSNDRKNFIKGLKR